MYDGNNEDGSGRERNSVERKVEPRSKPICAGIVLRNMKNEYLLVLGRDHSKWSFPKGHIEPGESWEECACREMFEETGLIVDIPTVKNGDRPPSSSEYVRRHKRCFTQKSVYFLLKADSVQGTWDLAPRDTNEIVRIEWFDRKRLLSLDRDSVNVDLWQFINALKWIY